jgi:hypothetical protein
MFNLSSATRRSRGGKTAISILVSIIGVIIAGLGNTLAQAPTIIQPPIAPTIFLGDPATLQVTATGTAPLVYQWYRDATLLPGATGSNYTIPAVATADHNAFYSVRVTNASGSATSAPVVLTVDLGIPGAAVTNRVLNFNSSWRYNLSNNLDAVNWMAPGYNDANWPTGPGLLAAENNGAITPLIGTSVPAPNTPPPGLAPGHAYYFRTAINVAGNNLIPGALVATLRADDGAVIYVNGEEGLRLRLPGGLVTNTSFTTGFPPGENTDATQNEILPLEIIALPPGPNVIAASVHQANSGSSDLVWGMALDAIEYQRVRDTVAPTVMNLVPTPNSIVPGMNSLEVIFSEGVKGINAADLLINGAPATNVTEYADDVYLFQFSPQPLGPVQITWAAGAGITDRSANSNSFAGGSYNYTVNPNATGLNVRITEFMAGNTTTIRDNDGDYSDWIEIHNAGTDSVNLGGWYLTDNSGNLTKWRFPTGLLLPPDAYLIVWASDEDRRNVAAPLHTNFKLTKTAGNFLGLVYSDGVTVLSSFASYPTQYDDISYGRDRVESTLLGYFNTPTPGAINTSAGPGFTSPVRFSRSSGTFQSPFQLTLTTPDSNSIIRYFLVTTAAAAAITNVPDSSSPVYTGPLNVTGSVQVRARAFSTQPNTLPGEPTSETFLQITAGAASFSSDVPIVLLHNFGGNTPPATTDQNAVMMVFDNKYGRASLTNPPAVASRIGINVRGSSTQDFAKKSFAVETWDEFNDDASVSVLDMPAESDWVFYAPNAFDKPWLHNPLMHELSRSIGRYSPRVRMVEVFTCFNSGVVNYSAPTIGHYNGVYVLQEKIKADAERVNIPRLDPGDTNALAITGGYLLKIDRRDADERDFNAGGQTMVFVEPQMKDYNFYPGRPLQQNYIASYFNSFFAALTGANWTNPVTGYAAWIDVDAWVDHHILNVLALSSDALRLSAYLFKNRDQKIEMGPLWDFDRGLGSSTGNEWRSWNPRSWTSSNPSGSAGGTDYGTDYFNPAWLFANPWYSRIVKDPNFWQKWIDRYQTLRPTEFSTNAMFAIIDSLTNKLGVAQSREIARWSDSAPRAGTVLPPGDWPDRTYFHNFPGTYAGEIAFLKRWLADRLNFIDTNFLARPTLNLTSGLVSVGQTVTITPAAKTNTRLLYTLNGTDPRLSGGAVSPLALSNNGPVTVTISTNIRVFARSWNPTHQNLTGVKNPPISSPWSGPTVESFYTGIPPLRVTEIMYHPPAPPVGNTNDADNFEFIELQNTGIAPLNLQGARLSGGIDFVFPSLVLTGGQHVVVVKNLAAFQSRYGAPPLVAGVFTNNLSNTDDQIILHGALGEPILDFSYSDSWYPATDGEGFSLVIVNALAPAASWKQKSAWRPSGALNGSPGVADPMPASIPGILITEVLTHTDPPQLDTIELYNPTINNVDLGGWFLTDDVHEPKKYRIPGNNVINPGSYRTFTTTQFGSGPTGFAFGSTGDSVYLYSGGANTNLTGYAYGFTFGAAPNPVSFGRFLNSQSRQFYPLQSVNTLGQRNAYPRVGPVIISEIMYHPPDLFGGADDIVNEFIELQNLTGTSVPLYDVNNPANTWRLRDAVDFDFPPGLILTAGQRLLVVGFDPNFYGGLKAALQTKYNIPTNILILGPWSGKLDNSGDTIELERPDNPNVSDLGTIVPYYAVEKVAYADTTPWPASADGAGHSLQRIEPTLFANDPLNWQAGAPTAGQLNPIGPMVDIDGDGLPDAWELANAFDPQFNGGTDNASGDGDNDGANNFHEYVAGTNPHDSNDYLRFTNASVNNQICQLAFQSRLGRIYAIESTSDLALQTPWPTLTNGISGSGGIITINDPQTGTRYYRLKVSLDQ